MNVGQLCVKISGRDAGKTCVIVHMIEGNFVLVDGNTRRRKCNLSHLEPLLRTLPIPDNASHEDVVNAFKNAGIAVEETKKRTKAQKEKGAKPLRKKVRKQVQAIQTKAAKPSKPKAVKQ